MLAFDSHFSETHPNGCKHCHLDFHNTIALQKHLDATHPGVSSDLATGDSTLEVDTGHAFGSVPSENDGASASEVIEGAAIEGLPSTTHPSALTEGSGITQMRPTPAEAGLSNSGPTEPATPSLLSIASPDTTTATQEGRNTTPSLGSGDYEEAKLGSPLPSSDPLDANERAVADLAIEPPQSAPHRNRIWAGRRKLHYCGKCNMGFPTISELKQHLDHSIPILERAFTSDGGKHKEVVHGLQPLRNDGEVQPQAPASTNECSPAVGSASAPGHSLAPEPIIAETRPGDVAPGSRPLDLLFASLLLPASLTTLEVPPIAPSISGATEVLPPQPLPSSPLESTQSVTRVGLAPSTTTPAASSARPPRPFRYHSSQRLNPLYCNRCQVAFTNLQEQKEHLRKGISAIIPDENNEENLVCAQCKESNRDIHVMKAHLQSHETTCIECLIYFHGPKGLQDHRELQHMASPNDEGTSANSLPQPQPSPIANPPPEMRPANPPSDQASSRHSSQTLLPQENPQSSVDIAATFPSTVIQTPGPSLSNASETVDVRSSPSLASTALTSQPAHPARSDPLFCRKCRLAFANSQERKDHWRNGMSAIKPAQNDDASLVCAQCNRVFANIRVMKAHLRSHDMTCISCLLYFHTHWAIREHKQSLHTTNSGSGDDLPVEQPQAQPSPIMHPPPEQRPASPPPDPTERPAVSARRETKMNHPISTTRNLEAGKTRKDSVALMRMRTPFGRAGMYRDAIRDLEAGGGQRNRDGGGKASLNLLLGTPLRLVAYPATLIQSKLQHRPSRATFTQKYLESRQWPFHAVSA
ncbi:hypothetical protein FRC01_005075 [Tulasnella sp. 417]|nr:hypothetical protein FRC01_005075 [Tulasnella sp. 417]